MNRREFLKGSTAAAAAALAASCTGGNAGKKTASKKPEGEMTFRTDPSDSEKVSLLGYGCMRWPTLDGESGVENIGGGLDQEQINYLVDKAIASGINYFDTSPVYCRGLSEKVTGIALSRHPRSSYKIATKMSNFSDSSLEASKAMYRKSFEDLQVDYIDYYLLHSIGRKDRFEKRFVDNGMMDFLLQERREGRIRHLGFSFHGSREGFDSLMEVHEKYHWDFVQIQMNYAEKDAEYLYEELYKRGIPAIVMEPLLGGSLAKLPQHLATQFQQRDPFSSPASWAMRYCGTFPGVLTVLSGMTYEEHLDDNLHTFSPLKPISDEDRKFLKKAAALLERYALVPCTACNYCMPCPYGIDIPGLFGHYNKCVKEDIVNPNPEDPEYRRMRRKFLRTYTNAVAPERQADKCIGCGKCSEACPQKIDIPRQIRKIDVFVENLRRNG